MSANRAQLLKDIGLKAGHCLKDFFGKKLDIRKKGELDLVTQADETAERLIVDAISSTFPNDAILAEEGHSKEGDSGYQWIIDPLDGTTNFSHAFPHFSVSIALSHQNEVTHGLVYDPIKDECFEARLGVGAWLNGNPIRIGWRENLSEALAVTGFSYDRRDRMDFLLERVRLMLNHCQGMRRLGSAALDLCYIASGRFDVYIEDGLNAWDIAAGQLIVREAGGLATQLNGGPLSLTKGEVLAANPAIHAQALQRLIH